MQQTACCTLQKCCAAAFMILQQSGMRHFLGHTRTRTRTPTPTHASSNSQPGCSVAALPTRGKHLKALRGPCCTEVYEDTSPVQAYDINLNCFYGQQTFNELIFNAVSCVIVQCYARCSCPS